MALFPRKWINQTLRNRAAADWARIRRNFAAISPGRLRDLRADATRLRKDLDQFLLVSERRVLASLAALDSLPLPPGTDWRWRPEVLNAPAASALVAPANRSHLTEGTVIWHDCPEHALIVEQSRNTRATDLASFGLRVEAFGFEGSFLSLSIDLPAQVLDGLTRHHIIRLETVIQTERAQNIYARLNIGNGPNTEEMLRHLGDLRPGEASVQIVEFDLALTEMNEKRLDKIWLDLIFEKPAMSAATIREMIFSRHLRANL
ncbi:MAG: DUF6478 family protein [Paracoccus sp. (in: a-proteobacteria)]|nr:DUF6478 family protein [Paracoccus sp. (in: a-proteobacteria)]